MAPKKSCNKNATEEKENFNKKNFVQKQNFSKKISNNSNKTGGSVLLATPKEEIKTPNDENAHLLIQENGLNEKEMNEFILCNISNKYDELDVNPEHTDPQAILGQKRRIEELSDTIVDKDNMNELFQLKKKCFDIEKRIEILEKKWMPCPDHLDMVQNIFNNLIEDIHKDSVVTNNNNIMSNLNGGLNISPEILSGLKRNNSTSTARAIIKHLFPNPPINFKLSDVDPTLASDIVCHCKACHPDDTSTTTQIRRAMSNYFALINHRKKRKSSISNTGIQDQ